MEEFNFVICGQVLTGRLEVMESYFKKRFSRLFVIGLSSIYARENSARASVYNDSNKIFEKKITSVRVKNNNFSKWFFFPFAYTLYFLNSILLIISFRRFQKNLIFIGLGFFPAFIGLVLKKLKLVKKLIYYNMDYFPPANKAFDVRIFIQLDRLCARESNLVWVVVPRIMEAREKFSGLAADRYCHIHVPLCFDESLLRLRPIEEVERWSVVFVGTPGFFHGLDLLMEAMPKLIEIFPLIKIKIIGPGPWDEVKKKVNRLGLSGHFDFVGFIKKEPDLFALVSRCALGLALYVPVESNPTYYADPGKPKLYAFCAVPVVISKVPPIFQEITAQGAGRAIDFDSTALIEAIKDILFDDSKWLKYRQAAFNFALGYTSNKVFGQAIEESREFLN